jgi:hypothetical protein
MLGPYNMFILSRRLMNVFSVNSVSLWQNRNPRLKLAKHLQKFVFGKLCCTMRMIRIGSMTS